VLVVVSAPSLCTRAVAARRQRACLARARCVAQRSHHRRRPARRALCAAMYASMRPSRSFNTSSSFGAAAQAYAEESSEAGGSYTSLGAADALDGAPSSPAPLVLELEVVVDAPTLVSDGISTFQEFPLRTRSSLPTCVVLRRARACVACARAPRGAGRTPLRAGGVHDCAAWAPPLRAHTPHAHAVLTRCRVVSCAFPPRRSFSCATGSVRRRLSDFVCLRERLRAFCPGARTWAPSLARKRALRTRMR
jgi:hypothetical protein